MPFTNMKICLMEKIQLTFSHKTKLAQNFAPNTF